jgi:hypothetical protein
MDDTPAPRADRTSPTTVLLYFGLFVGIHILGALLFWFVVNITHIPRPRWIGLGVIAGAAYLMGYIFVRRRHRIFTSTETWWLVCLCGLYLVVLELVADFGKRESFRLGRDGPLLGNGEFTGVVMISCALQLLILILALMIGAPRMMRRYVDNQRSDDA